jgi:hypothetical protein
LCALIDILTVISITLVSRQTLAFHNTAIDYTLTLGTTLIGNFTDGAILAGVSLGAIVIKPGGAS